MTSISSVNNTAALTILKSVAQAASGNASADAEQSQIFGLGSQNTAIQSALDAITRIILNSGETFKGGVEGDNIQANSNSDIDAGDGDNNILANANNTIRTGSGNNQISVNASNTITTGNGNDKISVNASNTIDAGNGNNYIFANADNLIRTGDGNDVIEVNSGNTIYAGAGDDKIFGNSNNVIHAGDGNDEIFAAGNSVIDGGAGDDRISAGWGSQIRGGLGDDVIAAIGAGSTIHYDVGDGKDRITAISDATTLSFGEAISAENTKIEVSGNTAIISFAGNDSDQITVNLTGGKLTLAFSDGTSFGVEALPEPQRPPQAYLNNWVATVS